MRCAQVNELRPGQWSGGGGIGFLADTPDGIAEFAEHAAFLRHDSIRHVLLLGSITRR